MKRIIAGILCAVLLCLSLAIVSSAKQPPATFLVLGDSIAAGSGVSDKADAYAWLVAEAQGYDLTNLGAGGDTSAMMLEKLKSDTDYRSTVKQADIIAVSIGGNDLLHAEDVFAMIASGLAGDYDLMEPVLTAFAKNFRGIVKELHALNPKAKLIVQTLYNPAFPMPVLYRAYGNAIQGINAGILSYLDQHPGAFLLADVYSAFLGKSGLVFLDMTHPSAAGHAVIAAVLLNTLNETQNELPASNRLLDVLLMAINPAVLLLNWVAVEAARLITLFL